MVQAVMDPPTSSSSTGAQESLETSWSSRDTSPGAVTISEGSSMSPAAVHALHGSQSGMTHETQMQAGTSDSCADHEQEMFDIQRAARLSYASLQWLPESSNEVCGCSLLLACCAWSLWNLPNECLHTHLACERPLNSSCLCMATGEIGSATGEAASYGSTQLGRTCGDHISYHGSGACAAGGQVCAHQHVAETRRRRSAGQRQPRAMSLRWLMALVGFNDWMSDYASSHMLRAAGM